VVKFAILWVGTVVFVDLLLVIPPDSTCGLIIVIVVAKIREDPSGMSIEDVMAAVVYNDLSEH